MSVGKETLPFVVWDLAAGGNAKLGMGAVRSLPFLGSGELRGQGDPPAVGAGKQDDGIFILAGMRDRPARQDDVGDGPGSLLLAGTHVDLVRFKAEAAAVIPREGGELLGAVTGLPVGVENGIGL